MKRTKPARKKPARKKHPSNARTEPADYTDRRRYTAEPIKARKQLTDLAYALERTDALIQRGVATEAQREDLRRIFSALLTAGETTGPRNDRACDLVRRILRKAPKPTPVQRAIAQRRVALIRALDDLRRELDRPSKLGWLQVIRTLRHIDPAFARLTRAQCERVSARGLRNHRFAAALSVAVGAFGDRDEEEAFKRFESAASLLSRKAH